MNTMVVELRYRAAKNPSLADVIDALNDLFVCLDHNLHMDILSISHVYYTYPNGLVDFSSTGVIHCNEQTLESVAHFLEGLNGQERSLHAWKDVSKVSVAIGRLGVYGL